MKIKEDQLRIRLELQK